ncbi:MAG: 3-deoxy-D-manno-octulosonic acid transferase [Chitinophagales bacterium]
MKTVAIVFVLMIVFGISLIFFQQIYYTLVVTVYHTMIRIAALFNKKAKLWVNGRKNLFARLEPVFSLPAKKTVWFHCASLGEFEQARPVIEKLKRKDTQVRILLTFYSPSGYEIRKDYTFADHVDYFPADTRTNAKKFLSIVKPDIAIFVKYEFWLHHISAIHEQKIPLYLISSIFRKKQLFFKWYGRLHKEILKKYTRIFVQNQESLDLLSSIKIKNAEISFDTRFDRVKEIAATSNSYPEIETFVEGYNIIIGGSTWPTDERILAKAFYRKLVHLKFKLIIVPHNVDVKYMKQTKKRFKKFSLLWSNIGKALPEDLKGKRVLVIDNIGMLSSIYKYGHINYIGGGFGKGVHNTLEAAVYGKPLIIGPRYKKFNEAVEMVKENAAFEITDADDVINRLDLMNHFQFVYTGAGKDAKNYVDSHVGGTDKIVRELKKVLSSGF